MRLFPQTGEDPASINRAFLLAALAGCLAGAVGTGFILALSWLSGLVTALCRQAQDLFGLGYWAAGAAGAALTLAAVVMTARLAPEAAGSGIPEVEGALLGVRPMRVWPMLPVKFAGGLFSLAAGLALGREGPVVQMGSALASLTARLTTPGQEHVRKTLAAAGAGAGLAAAFNAPLSGILFVVEELRESFRFDFVSINCLVIATACADVVRRAVLGQGAELALPEYTIPSLGGLWAYAVFGTATGALGAAFNAGLLWVLGRSDRLTRGGKFVLAGITGAVSGVLAFSLPHMAGRGFVVVASAMDAANPVWLLLAVLAGHFLWSLCSYATGVPGGLFAPLLTLGSLLGLSYGAAFAALAPAAGCDPHTFALAGMTALFAATVRAPLTGLALVLEMTGNFELILPLAVCGVTAMITAEALGSRPVYTSLLMRRQAARDSREAA
jgi:chloride channel protein, CIC family